MTTKTKAKNGGETAVATTRQKTPVQQFRDLLNRDDMKQQIAAALPNHITPERMIRVAMTAVATTPDLHECSSRSLLGCIVEASQLGLEPGGVLGHAYLVPYKNKKTGQKEAQLQIGYKGLIDLARRSGNVGRITAEIVYANDEFIYTKGLDPTMIHVPAWNQERGEAVAAYATAKLKDETIQFEVMSCADIESKHRSRSQAARGGSSPWTTDFEWMCKKTVLRQLCKLLPASIEVQTAVNKDELREIGKMFGDDFTKTPELPPAPASLQELGAALGDEPEAPVEEVPEDGEAVIS